LSTGETRSMSMQNRLRRHAWEVFTGAILANGHTSALWSADVLNVHDNRMGSGGIKHAPLI
jgi:hypothetical protein